MPNFDHPVTEEDVQHSNLNEVSSALGEVYFIRKEAEDEQQVLRKEFFETVTVSFEDQDLARKTVEIPEDIATADSQAYVQKYYPGWRVVSIEEDPAGLRTIIEEDPAFKQHAEVVPLEPWEVNGKTVYGYVVTKTVRSGTPLVDIERMQIVDPELYESVTDYPFWALAAKDYARNDGAWRRWIEEVNPPRVLRGDLTPEEFEAVKTYTYESPKTLALNVRYAKEGEDNAS